MGLLGDILAAPVRLANAPIRAAEKLLDPDSDRDDEANVASKPLESLAQAIEEALE